MLGSCFYKHSYCTDSDIIAFLLLLSLPDAEVTLDKRLLNALKVNVYIMTDYPIGCVSAYSICALCQTIKSRFMG